MVTKERFVSITLLVIKHVEGGYYHPSMLKSFNSASREILKNSGETLFGLDRLAGKDLSQYSEWETFWDIIDADKKANPGLWVYQYRGGKLEGRLKEIAASIMYQWFLKLSKKYILVGSMDEIDNDPRLLAHFSYAAWNGEGWFRRYARALNNAIAKHEGNKEEIFKVAFDERLNACKYVVVNGKEIKTLIPNKAIRQQAINMRPIFKEILSV